MGNNKKFVVEANFIQEACKLNLTLAEFLLLIYFENADDSTFESEFRRPLTGTEFEVIKAWMEKMYNEDLILAALKEAVYNGATNIRYIDTILYEWNKKGLKTKEDVDNYLNNRYENKKIDETAVFEYNWLDDYDK